MIVDQSDQWVLRDLGDQRDQRDQADQRDQSSVPGAGWLRVMSYNVRQLRDDRVALVDVLRALAPDVVALQEPPRGPRGGARLRRLGHDAGLRVAVGGRGARTTALLVRAGLTTSRPRAVRLPSRPGRTRRGACTVDVGGVRVMSAHLGLHAAERRTHVDRLLRTLRSAPGPVLLGVDLNERPGGPSWSGFALHLHDVGGPAPTFPAAAPVARIDALLAAAVASDGVRPVDLTRWPGLAGPLSRASDHLPVVVDLRTPQALPAARDLRTPQAPRTAPYPRTTP